MADDSNLQERMLMHLAGMVTAQNKTSEVLAAAITEIAKPMVEMGKDVAVVKARTEDLHTPLNCPLRADFGTAIGSVRSDLSAVAKEVKEMRLREAWRSGAWAMMGGVIVLVGNRLWESVLR